MSSLCRLIDSPPPPPHWPLSAFRLGEAGKEREEEEEDKADITVRTKAAVVVSLGCVR